jgi:hypothetical protein
MHAPYSEQIVNPPKFLSIAVTFPGEHGKPGPVVCNRRGEQSEGNPDPNKRRQAIKLLQQAGFEVSTTGQMSVSIRGTQKDFEAVFRTKLVRESFVEEIGPMSKTRKFLMPPDIDDEHWKGSEQLSGLIDDAYIQWPHIYMNQRFDRGKASPLPPQTSQFSLSIPGDVSMLLGADKAHRAGFTGRGIRVAMIDSGFAHGHPYFTERGYHTATVLAPDANEPNEDGSGHGTGESANLLAVAPDVDFTGVKLDHEGDPSRGATILEGLQTALQHNPQVISVSLGIDLRDRNTGLPLTFLPNNLAALEAEIRAAVNSGIVVVFSAGNGHISFPGMMREVISAGGVFVDPFGGMEASDYASAFSSKVYTSPNRKVPDCCGLVGRSSNSANYIMLPIPPHCEIDRSNAMVDGTQPNNGWGAFSGTSAAAPQLAGACALLLQKNTQLTPADARHALESTARAIRNGIANPASNPGRRPLRGRAATGRGLIDVSQALQQV